MIESKSSNTWTRRISCGLAKHQINRVHRNYRGRRVRGVCLLRSAKEGVDDTAMDVGQSEFSARVFVGQFQVIDPQ